jgi:hypothetical protein
MLNPAASGQVVKKKTRLNLKKNFKKTLNYGSDHCWECETQQPATPEVWWAKRI